MSSFACQFQAEVSRATQHVVRGLAAGRHNSSLSCSHAFPQETAVTTCPTMSAGYRTTARSGPGDERVPREEGVPGGAATFLADDFVPS